LYEAAKEKADAADAEMTKELAKFEKINKEKQRVAEAAREEQVKELKAETLAGAAAQKQIIEAVGQHMQEEYQKLQQA